MTTVETPTSTSAGFSGYCLRQQHTTCKSVRARCTCSCHGRNGQTPPGAAKEPTVTAIVDAVPAPPAPTNGNGAHEDVGFQCPECGKTFAKPQGLGPHRAKAHGYRADAAHRPPPRTKAEGPTHAPEARHRVGQGCHRGPGRLRPMARPRRQPGDADRTHRRRLHGGRRAIYRAPARQSRPQAVRVPPRGWTLT